MVDLKLFTNLKNYIIFKDMELTVLVDNNTQKDYDLLAEFGLSILIEDDFHKVLFDCGYSDVFIKNAYHMNIELGDVTDIVLSHSHNDHTGGFLWLQNLYKKLLKVGFVINNKRLIVHPYVFQPHYDENFENIGFPGDVNSISDFFDITYTKEPYHITENLIYLGEFPVSDSSEDPDESALVYTSPKGLVIISACSHAGLVNIVEYAKKVTNQHKIYAIFGGIHLLEKSDADVKKLGIYLQRQGVQMIYPCHCCDLRAKIILSKYIPVKEAYSGFKMTV